METTRTIERERWQRYLENHAEQLRTVTAEVYALRKGATGQAIDSLFVEELVYDPDEDCLRLTGQKGTEVVIAKPAKVFAKEGGAGELTALEIVDANDLSHVITFRQPKAIGR